MDVTCSRCSTVYEIEEGTVSPAGMTVKCTQCGHLFKVRGTARPAPTPGVRSADRAPLSSSPKWRVRRGSQVHGLESLAELSHAIAEGRFQESDEISGTGQAWKRLGDIAELSALFSQRAPRIGAASSVRSTASGPPLRSEREAVQLSMPLPPPRSASSSARGRRTTPFPEPEFNVMGVGVSVEGTNLPLPGVASGPSAGMTPPQRPSPAALSASLAARSTRTRIHTPAPPAAPESAARPQATPPPDASPPESGAVNTAAGARLAEITAPAPAGPTRTYLWIAISLPLILGAGIAGAWLAGRPWGASTPAAREFLLRADEALAAHRLSRFEEAAAEYTKALAFHEDDPHILSSLSRVYAVWAQMLRSQAQALSADSAERSAELVRLQVESERLAELARTHGERAAQRNPGNVEAEIALSDALRLTGNPVAARAELDRARKNERSASAEALRVSALLAIDEAHGDLRAGRPLAQQAVELEPKLLRARFLLIEGLVAEGQLEAARLHLDAVRSMAPDHPLLLQVSRALDRASRRPASALASAATRDAPSDGTPTATDLTITAGADTSPSAAQAPKATETPVTVVSPEAAADLVERGERALEDGAVRNAQSLFEEALTLAPRFPPALTGLGYVALERGHMQVALRRFMPATRANHAEAWIGLGDTYRRMGRAEDALKAYQTYVKRFPRGVRRSIAERQIQLLREQLATTVAP